MLTLGVKLSGSMLTSVADLGPIFMLSHQVAALTIVFLLLSLKVLLETHYAISLPGHEQKSVQNHAKSSSTIINHHNVPIMIKDTLKKHFSTCTLLRTAKVAYVVWLWGECLGLSMAATPWGQNGYFTRYSSDKCAAGSTCMRRLVTSGGSILDNISNGEWYLDVSWCILMYLDVSWCILMYLDVSWCILMYLDVSWCILDTGQHLQTTYSVSLFLSPNLRPAVLTGQSWGMQICSLAAVEGMVAGTTFRCPDKKCRSFIQSIPFVCTRLPIKLHNDIAMM